MWSLLYHHYYHFYLTLIPLCTAGYHHSIYAATTSWSCCGGILVSRPCQNGDPQEKHRARFTWRSTMDSATLEESDASSTTDDKHPGLTADARFRYWVIHCCLSKKTAASARRALATKQTLTKINVPLYFWAAVSDRDYRQSCVRLKLRSQNILFKASIIAASAV